MHTPVMCVVRPIAHTCDVSCVLFVPAAMADGVDGGLATTGEQWRAGSEQLPPRRGLTQSQTVTDEK